MAAAYKFIVCLSEIESPLFAKPNFSKAAAPAGVGDERLCHLFFQWEKLKYSCYSDRNSKVESRSRGLDVKRAGGIRKF